MEHGCELSGLAGRQECRTIQPNTGVRAWRPLQLPNGQRWSAGCLAAFNDMAVAFPAGLRKGSGFVQQGLKVRPHLLKAPDVFGN